MTEKEIQSKMEEMEKDERFMKRLFSLESFEDIQAALKEKDIDLSMEEVKELVKKTMNQVNMLKDNDELSEMSLQEVAGGRLSGSSSFIYTLAKCAIRYVIKWGGLII